MARKQLLDQKLVNEFAEYRALKNKIEKWLKSLREEFLAKLQDGFVCPADGPFLLIAEPVSPRVSWRDELLAYMTERYRQEGVPTEEAEKLAAVEIANIEAVAKAQIARELESGEREKSYELNVKPNPAFAGKVVAAVVRKIDLRTARGF